MRAIKLPKSATRLSLLLGTVLMVACSEGPTPQENQAKLSTPSMDFISGGSVEGQGVTATLTSVSTDRILSNDDAEWITHGGDYAETRFSTLDQLNTENIDTLGLAFSHDLGTDRGVEATPLIADGVIYVTSTFNIVTALDARSGEVLWTFMPEIDKSQAANACCGVVNRGVAMHGDHVFIGTIDGRLIALDRKTGEPSWDILTVDQSKPYTITGAPRVIPTRDKEGDKALVIIGNGGAELGVRGYVSAYDAATGEKVWRFYTVPGNPADGFEDEAVAKAAETWAGEWWTEGGGGTVWDSMAYDPDLGLLYIGVGNGSPWNHRLRSNGEGDNLYLSSMVALDASTGEYRWHFQTTPGDNWDYTATQHMVLADLEIDGESVPVIMQAPKNGFFYVIDRRDGAFVSGEAFVPMNWATGLDANGRPIEAPGARYAAAPHLQLPGPLGAHNWHPMSYSPIAKGGTGLVYIPAQEAAWAYANNADYKPSDVEGVWNTGTDFSISTLPDDRAILKAGRAGLKGRLLAWDPVAQEARWSVEHKGAWNGGVLSTAGGLVFQGTADGSFAAFDAQNGKRLWSQFVETGVVAAPITYALDGQQYIAIATGWGGSLAHGYGGVFPTGPDHNTGRLLVFKAEGQATLPEVDVAAYEPELPPIIEASAETLAHGRRMYANHCSACHGDSAISFGGMPNLRYSYAVGDAQDWADIVGAGALSEGGMPAFNGALNADDLEAIRAFISERAHSEQQPDWYANIVAEVEAETTPTGGTSGRPR